MIATQMPVDTAFKAALRHPSPQAIAGYYAAMRQFWHPVMPSADLPAGVPKGAVLLDEEIVLARLNGEIVAMEDLCRHFQAKLSGGEVRTLPHAGDCLMCP